MYCSVSLLLSTVTLKTLYILLNSSASLLAKIEVEVIMSTF